MTERIPHSEQSHLPGLSDPVETYLHLTRTVMPNRAQLPGFAWPVTADHCFQRIVLDTLFGDVWYAHLAKPAYKNMTHEQALQAVRICYDILEGRRDMHALNAASLRYRGKGRR